MNRVLTSLLGAALLTGAASAARAEAPLYEIKKTEPKVAAGGKAAASITIDAKSGWHLNAEAPITVSLTPAAGISVAKAKLARADLAASSKESARFDVAFEAGEAGTRVITAETHFVLCQESACKPVKETLALNIEVTAPTAKAAGKPKSRTK